MTTGNVAAPVDAGPVTAALDERAVLRQALFDAGLLLDTGVPGLVGQGSAFVDLRERVDGLLTRAAAAEGAERLAFPPLMPRGRLEASGYLHSFPHLAGSVWSFDGDEASARAMAAQADAGQAWGEHLAMTDLVLVPAACHPVYPALAGRARSRRVASPSTPDRPTSSGASRRTTPPGCRRSTCVSWSASPPPRRSTTGGSRGGTADETC